MVGFNASNLPSGVYFYRMETEGFADTKKMMLIK
ncbi:MAG: T9SS type A sorting domain-containing protein [Ignavibacteria bacterium]|nr:T9SS type A sorting domain-containing protein [Ignavibacteria bacterium]